MPTIVTPTPRIESECTELWADPTDLLTRWDHAFPTATVADAELALAEATWLLWSLTHWRFHGPQCWSEDYRIAPDQNRLELAQWPVEDVFLLSVLNMCPSVSGTGEVLSGWCHLGNGVVRLTPGSNFYTIPNPCGTSRAVRVEYRTLNNLPFGSERAALTLADQFYRARVGSPCKLPERITSVTRQGVSWTVLDPMDFLNRGLTGIGSIDLWLTAANGRGPSRLIDPLIRSHRLSSTLIGCGDCGQGGDMMTLVGSYGFGPYGLGPYGGEG